MVILCSLFIMGLFANSALGQPANTNSFSHVRSAQLPLEPLNNSAQAAPLPAKYNQQFGMSFTQNFISLAYNVTAVDQVDEYGYGPAYLLNGLSDTGYWYQVGLSYNWPYVGVGYSQGFAFNYQVFAPNGSSVYPTYGGGGLAPFSGPINSGDTILLNLEFYGGYVVMYAEDWNTGAHAYELFSDQGATYFGGSPYSLCNYNGYFTGLMTEWYHATPYYNTQSKVTFSNYDFDLSSAWLWMDEFDAANPYWEGTWLTVSAGPNIFDYPKQVYTLTYLGIYESCNANEFTTGTIEPVKTSITLLPAGQSTPLTASNNFKIHYTLNGHQLTAQARNKTLVIKADSGTDVLITGSSTDSSSSEMWVLNSQAKDVIITAGTNATYYYYDLLAQRVSFTVSGGGTPSEAVITYISAPEAASAQPLSRIDKSLALSNYKTIMVLRGSTVSMVNPILGSPSEQWVTTTNTSWVITGVNQIPARIVYDHQYLLSYAGIQQNWQWVTSSTTVEVQIAGIPGRTAGTGQRVTSYSIDEGTPILVQPTSGTITIRVLMNGPHQLAVNLIKQIQVNIDSSVSSSLAYITPPTINGDNYWYDQNSEVSLTLNGVFNRESNMGNRLESVTINGITTLASSLQPINVLNLGAISSPVTVTQSSVKQYKLTTESGYVESITAPSIEEDQGWYDAGTQVTLFYNYSWNQSIDQSRANAFSYTINQGAVTSLGRNGNGAFPVRVTMTSPQFINVSAVTQYSLIVSGAFNGAILPASPTGDSFYDAGTSITFETNYVGETVNGNTRQSIISYALDGLESNYNRKETGRFTTPQIQMDQAHELTFNSVTQYLANFNLMDSSGTYTIAPTTFEITTDQNYIISSSKSSMWVDSGTSFQISSILWQNADIKPSSLMTYTTDNPLNETVTTRVYCIKLTTNDYLGLPISGAQITVTLGNGTVIHTVTDSKGAINIPSVPLGTFNATIMNLNIATSVKGDASTQTVYQVAIIASYPIIAIISGVIIIIALVTLLVRRYKSKSKRTQ